MVIGPTERNNANVLPGEKWRVDECFKRGFLKGHDTLFFFFREQRSTVFPFLWQFHGGAERQTQRLLALRIDEHIIPVHRHDLWRRDRHEHRSAFAPCGEQEIETDFHFLCGLGHDEMERERIGIVAFPFQSLAVGQYAELGDIGNLSDRPVSAGNPLGVVQRERSWLGRDHFTNVNYLSPDFGRIDAEFDRGGAHEGRKQSNGEKHERKSRHGSVLQSGSSHMIAVETEDGARIWSELVVLLLNQGKRTTLTRERVSVVVY